MTFISNISIEKIVHFPTKKKWKNNFNTVMVHDKLTPKYVLSFKIVDFVASK